jgi:seryl-tRNA synthetase
MKTENASLVMGYWEYTPLEELHRRSRLWLSEIAFWQEELAFMQKLIKNHFLYFTDEKRRGETNRLMQQMNSLTDDLKAVKINVQEHESHLAAFMLAKSNQKEKTYRTEHGTLEQLLSRFMEDYKATKQQLFREADEVLQEEKMQRFINLAG